jgi:gluconolactonase
MVMKFQFLVFLLASLNCLSQSSYKTIGSIERYDSSINQILSRDAKAEVIADGLDWCEGPLWLEKQKTLLFSDVPKNIIYKWTEAKGKEVYLTPSGYTSSVPRGGEMGSNGLILDKKGNLVMCQCGDRRMARMDAPLMSPEAKFVTLADKHNGKRFSSPNDAAFSSKGELFFTDPPYGLAKPSDNEMPVNGVYKVKKNGDVVLLLDSLTRPNGVGFFPGGKKLLVTNSDPRKPNWYMYDVDGDKLKNGKIFYSAAGYDRRLKGLPDGFKIDKKGNVFSAGPGGIHIFNKNGKLLGMLKTPEATSNCSLSTDEKTLYITSDMYVLRFKLRN